MRLDPSIVARLLALPLEARRRLAEQGGDGRWILPGRFGCGPSVYPLIDAPGPLDAPLSEGAAYYLSDSAAWMLAAAGERLWMLHRGGAMIAGQEHSYPTAEECALSWFEAGNQPG